MPVHNFRCERCGCRFDQLFRSFAQAEGAVATCPACGTDETRRLISSVSILKGVTPGVGRAAYPTSWRQANSGDPETIKYWKTRAEREMSQESQDPGLRVEREIAANREWNNYLTRGLSERESAKTSEVLSAAADLVDRGESGHDHGHGHAHPHPNPVASALGGEGSTAP